MFAITRGASNRDDGVWFCAKLGAGNIRSNRKTDMPRVKDASPSVSVIAAFFLRRMFRSVGYQTTYLAISSWFHLPLIFQTFCFQ